MVEKNRMELEKLNKDLRKLKKNKIGIPNKGLFTRVFLRWTKQK